MSASSNIPLSPAARTGGPAAGLRAVFGPWSAWTVFERIWIGLFLVISTVVHVVSQGDLLSYVAAVTGVLCVVLIAKGRISNYVFGLVSVALYGWMSLQYSLYGEVALNWAYYVPMNILGLIVWRRRAVDRGESVRGEDVAVKTMTPRHRGMLALACAVAVVAVAWILRVVGGASVGLDSAAVVLSVVAMVLTVKRYTEQWALWIVVNVLSIALWVVTLRSQGGADATLVVMWSAYLVNSVYGFWNWSRMAAGQRAEAPTPTPAQEAVAAR